MINSKDAVINMAGETLEALLSSAQKNTGECKVKTVKTVVSMLNDAVSKLDDESQVNDSIYTYLAQTVF